MEPKFFPEDLVVGKSRNGKVRYAIVDQTPDMESDEFDSDYDIDDGDELVKGFVRLSWYPEGKHEKVHESKLQLVDRSALPCDVVREKNGKQLGTVVQVDVKCNAMVVGTSKTINNISANTLRFVNPFMPGDNISFGPWLGRVVRVYSGLLLVFPNGAKGQIPLDSKGCELLEDQFPHVTDEGSFFDDDCGYYPGQVLSGPTKAFKDIIWMDEQKTVQFKPKSRYKVIVEQVTLYGLKVMWGQRSFSEVKSFESATNKSGVTKQKDQGTNSDDPADIKINFKDLDVDLTMDWDAMELNLKFIEGLTPPTVIAGKLLKKVNRLMHFWTGNVHIGERYQYKLTTEDVVQLSQQVKGHQKKRTRRNVASRRANRKRMSNAKNSERSSKNPKKLNADDSSQASEQGSQTEEEEDNMSVGGDTGLPQQTSRRNSDPSVSTTEVIEDIPVVLNTNESEEQINEATIAKHVETADDDLTDIINFLRVWISRKDTEPFLKQFKLSPEQLAKLKLTFSNPAYALRQAFRDCTPLEALTAFHPHCLTSTSSTRQVGHKVEYHVGQYVTVDICSTSTEMEVEWQDGTVTKSLPSKEISQAHHIDQNDFCPGDFVCDERTGTDMYRYGVILKADSSNRMANVQWFRLHPNNNKVMALEKEEMSVYEVSDHPDFNFRISDILVRLSSPSKAEHTSGDAAIGELLRVTPDGKLHVKWCDGSITDVHPHELMRVGSDDDGEEFWNSPDMSDLDSEDSDSSGWEMAGSDEEDWPRVPESKPSPKTPGKAPKTPEPVPHGIDSSEIRERKAADQSAGDVTAHVTSTLDSEPSVEEKPNTSARGDELDDFPSFSSEATAPKSHHYRTHTFVVSDQKSFMKALRRDIKQFKNDLPEGIYVKVFEDRMDLLSALFVGPENTPYEDGVFAFDIQLPGDYPASPPRFHYISYSHRLNPNLYEDGKVCVSLLGTWMGKGNEKWTRDSNLLQVLVSIQGLILNSEPYYNEAGYEGHRGTTEGQKNSRCYNEMVILRLVEHMSALVFSPPRPFQALCRHMCPTHTSKLISRVEALLHHNDGGSLAVDPNLPYPLLPLSKGVVMSLKQKLAHLVKTAASVVEQQTS
uniref:E2/E3 hybrid ubiquitin-protein ligase UBE2O-like n=1 Tax=Phallusia mammillata TaxID=59560 RepID=A0A6F9DWE1_9ASCI|nr:E2/E3 hybrid ubiquitin-protein ligase UBE2O-like [Phallusia mammillata]